MTCAPRRQAPETPPGVSSTCRDPRSSRRGIPCASVCAMYGPRGDSRIGSQGTASKRCRSAGTGDGVRVWFGMSSSTAMSRDQESLIHINVESDKVGLILLSQKSVPHRRGEVLVIWWTRQEMHSPSLCALLPEATADLLRSRACFLPDTARKMVARLETTLIGDSAYGQPCLLEHFDPFCYSL